MKRKKIVFVLNNITLTRCLKRVNEFIDYGYDIEVFGFRKQGEEGYAAPSNFSISVIGEFSHSQSYFARLMVYHKSLKQLFKKFKNQDVIFYYFFFNIAFTARLLSRRAYIYEESDMPYTGIRNTIIRNWLGDIDRRIIMRSLLTVMTSEGFIDYHFGDARPHNIVVVPNRVNPLLLDLPYQHKELDINHLSIAFVGGFRYDSVLNFAKVIAAHFPQHDFHAYGVILEHEKELKSLCEKYSNIHFHGKFRNPDDLSSIYEKIDLVVATYDATYINAQYAEPNKMYEAIFFRTPIVVSSHTFLAKKVAQLGIGYHINALEELEVISFINGLTEDGMVEKERALKALPKEYAVNRNPELFEYLERC